MYRHSYFVYILASHRQGTLYIGVTNNLARRIEEHAKGIVDGFTKQYKTYLLVYFEQGTDIRSVIHREKQHKHWKRAWKIKLIEDANPTWRDLVSSV